MTPYDRPAYGVMGLQNFTGPSPAWDENSRNRAAMMRQIEESRKAAAANKGVKISLGKSIVNLGSLLTRAGERIKRAGHSLLANPVSN